MHVGSKSPAEECSRERVYIASVIQIYNDLKFKAPNARSEKLPAMTARINRRVIRIHNVHALVRACTHSFTYNTRDEGERIVDALFPM